MGGGIIDRREFPGTMVPLRKKRKTIERFLYSKITLSLLLFAAAFLAVSVWGVYEKERGTAEVRKKRAEELSNLRAREAELSSEIERLSTPEGIEMEIREKYELGKEGERVVVVIDPAGEDANVAGAEERGWFRAFLSFFGF